MEGPLVDWRRDELLCAWSGNCSSDQKRRWRTLFLRASASTGWNSESLKLFFCLTCCSFYDEMPNFAELLLLQPHLYRSYIIRTNRNESAVNCVGRLNERGLHTARPGSRWQGVQTMKFEMFLTYLPPKRELGPHPCDSEHLHKLPILIFSWVGREAALCTSTSTHTTPSPPLLLHTHKKNPFHDQVIIEARCRH